MLAGERERVKTWGFGTPQGLDRIAGFGIFSCREGRFGTRPNQDRRFGTREGESPESRPGVSLTPGYQTSEVGRNEGTKPVDSARNVSGNLCGVPNRPFWLSAGPPQRNGTQGPL